MYYCAIISITLSDTCLLQLQDEKGQSQSNQVYDIGC